MADQNDLFARGIAALQAGDSVRAFGLLNDARSAGASSPELLVGLSEAALAVNELETALDAADEALTHAPNGLRANLAKADALDAMGRTRAATAFYLAAIRTATPSDQTNAQTAAALNRAQQKCAEAARMYEEFLREQVNKLGLYDGVGQSAGEQALDILFGKRQIFYQQPEKFYFPELPQRQFYDAKDFDWTREIIAATDDILAELNGVTGAQDKFEPYVPTDAKTPHVRGPLVGNADWGAFHLKKDGALIPKNAARCPKTIAALSHVPAPIVPGKSPIALFSRLKPGAQIPPHTGLMNTRLICHLPLIAPQGCRLRVGNQTREWRLGEMLIFDDSIEHEAGNNSGDDRVVLLFDIWRPELSEDDRRFVSAVFDAIEEFGVF